jgi:hypothetical protein
MRLFTHVLPVPVFRLRINKKIDNTLLLCCFASAPLAEAFSHVFC